MTETPEQLRARRKKDRPITRKVKRQREELAAIGELVVRVDDEPEVIPELRHRID